jgi:hypothetical protein
MKGRIKYEFSGEIWRYKPPGEWHFVSLPIEIAKEIRENLKYQEEGWGRLKATAKIGSTEWETAIWFDTKMNTYILPLKATVRNKEKITVGERTEVILCI